MTIPSDYEWHDSHTPSHILLDYTTEHIQRLSFQALDVGGGCECEPDPMRVMWGWGLQRFGARKSGIILAAAADAWWCGGGARRTRTALAAG